MSGRGIFCRLAHAIGIRPLHERPGSDSHGLCEASAENYLSLFPDLRAAETSASDAEYRYCYFIRLCFFHSGGSLLIPSVPVSPEYPGILSEIIYRNISGIITKEKKTISGPAGDKALILNK